MIIWSAEQKDSEQMSSDVRSDKLRGLVRTACMLFLSRRFLVVVDDVVAAEVCLSVGSSSQGKLMHLLGVSSRGISDNAISL